jgi:hypothetical protein
MQPEKPLLGLQRAFLRSLREPVFGESRARTALPVRDGQISDAFTDTADRFIKPSPSLQPVERLELYHRQYWYRLLDSIEEDFPALQRVLGVENFWRLIEAYLETAPSHSYTLRHLGAGLADFIGGHPELAGSHPIHALELARLEYALCEAFEAAEWPPVSPEQLAGESLALQPHLRLFALRTPADELWRLDDEPIPDDLFGVPRDDTEFDVAAYRLRFKLHVERLDPAAFRLLQAIAEEGRLEMALERSGLAEAAEAVQAQVSNWFRVWTERGWICVHPRARQQVPIAFVPAHLIRVSLGRRDVSNSPQ